MDTSRNTMEQSQLYSSNSRTVSDDFSSQSQSNDDNSATVKNVLSALIEENLSKLFECLKVEYGRHVLVSPKWKNFGSQKLQFSEKTRLNNAIWRCWHIQFKKGKRPLFCQFVSPLSEEREPPKNNTLAVILQGRYWRRKLDAVAREYKRWRIYYKRKTLETDKDAARQRTRSLSTSSGDEKVTPRGSPMAQMMDLMESHISTDAVLSSHPDTLFTTKNNHLSPASIQPSEQRQHAVRDVIYQPKLDSLQPNLDEFVDHVSNLADLIAQQEGVQHPGLASSTSGLASTTQDLQAAQPSGADIRGSGMSFQVQGQMEMMEQSGSYEMQAMMYPGQPSGTQPTGQPAQGQEYMDTSESYPAQYSVEYQNYSAALNQPQQPQALSQLPEETPQEMYAPQSQQNPMIASAMALSPVGAVQQSPLQQNSSMLLPAVDTQQLAVTQASQSFASGNVGSMYGSPSKKGKLPRNVSDSQLYNLDSYGGSLKGLSLLPSYETELPTQVQFPNLVAQLQSIQGKRSEVHNTSTKQAKRARLPRNMSDSRLYSLGRVSKSSASQVQYPLPSAGTSGMTPLEQIQAQAQAQGLLPQSQIPATSGHSKFPQSTPQSKHTGYKTRKGRMPRNMSDSSLMYMGQYPTSPPSWVPPIPRKMSDPSVQVSPMQQMPTQLAGAELPAASSQLVLSLADRMQTAEPTVTQPSILEQLSQLSTQASATQTSARSPGQGSPAAASVLGQLLLQNNSQTAAAQKVSSDDSSQVMRQLVQLVQHQKQSTDQSGLPNSELIAFLKAQGEQTSELVSLLQCSVQQGNQHYQQQQEHQLHQHLQQQLQQHLLEQQQQLQKQAQQTQQSSQLISALQSTAHALQQQVVQPQQQFPMQPQQQAQQTQQSSQLISALQSTTNALKQQVVQPQQPQTTAVPVMQMANLGIQVAASCPVPIQPRTEPISIAPQPQASIGGMPAIHASAVPLQQSPPIMSTVTAKSALSPLQQMLESSSANQTILSSRFKLSMAAEQQVQAKGSREQMFSSSSCTGTEPSRVAGSPVVCTTAVATAAHTTSAVRSPPPSTIPKSYRPVTAANREQYKEHRRISHISAEQKRRCNIKVGFDQLVTMVPSLANQKNSKVSKATVLQKTVDYTTKLQRERQHMLDEETLLREEIQGLNNSINACQEQLPATGAPVNRQRADQMFTLFNDHIKMRAQENFKFWIFSVLIRQLFETYNNTVSTASAEEFCRTVLSWLDQHCTLPALRPAVLSALRDLSRSTSILTDPSRVPDEALRAANTDDPTNLANDGASASRPALGQNFFGGGTS